MYVCIYVQYMYNVHVYILHVTEVRSCVCCVCARICQPPQKLFIPILITYLRAEQSRAEWQVAKPHLSLECWNH